MEVEGVKSPFAALRQTLFVHSVAKKWKKTRKVPGRKRSSVSLQGSFGSAPQKLQRAYSRRLSQITREAFTLVDRGSIITEHRKSQVDAIDVKKEGNLEFYSKENVEKRKTIRENERLLEMTRELWKFVMKTTEPSDYISFTQYEGLLLKIHKTLAPDFDLNEAKELILEDWQRDTLGQVGLDYRSFHEAIFEIVDIWCDSLEPESYVDLLESILERVVLRDSLSMEDIQEEKEVSIEPVIASTKALIAFQRPTRRKRVQIQTFHRKAPRPDGPPPVYVLDSEEQTESSLGLESMAVRVQQATNRSLLAKSRQSPVKEPVLESSESPAKESVLSQRQSPVKGASESPVKESVLIQRRSPVKGSIESSKSPVKVVIKESLSCGFQTTNSDISGWIEDDDPLGCIVNSEVKPKAKPIRKIPLIQKPRGVRENKKQSQIQEPTRPPKEFRKPTVRSKRLIPSRPLCLQGSSCSDQTSLKAAPIRKSNQTGSPLLIKRNPMPSFRDEDIQLVLKQLVVGSKQTSTKCRASRIIKPPDEMMESKRLMLPKVTKKKTLPLGATEMLFDQDPEPPIELPTHTPLPLPSSPTVDFNTVTEYSTRDELLTLVDVYHASHISTSLPLRGLEH